ncbi:MAG: sigma-70 family RNA polymerase sigma factor [Thermoguttaceae bacterium]|nr:sigma-70 family RNA polymerase sigma factor [Thermoguttaceae bacterium]
MLSDSIDEARRKKAAQFFLANVAYARKVAAARAPNANVVDDIVNDVFLEFIGGAARWDFSRDLRPLLAAIATNVAKRYRRDCGRRSNEALSRLAETARARVRSNIENAERAAELKALEICVAKLPRHKRKLLDDFYFRRLSVVALARRDGRNVNAEYSELSRLRAELRREMNKFLSSGEIYGE